MLSESNREKQDNLWQTSTIDSAVKSCQSYAEMIRTKRQNAKDTSLKLKKLKYQFKDISSRILRSKTSTIARQVASQARREVLRLKREKQSGNYDSEEIEAAITHAKAMERVARKKVKHLEEEEMAKASGGPCADSMIAEEEIKETDEAEDIEDNEEIPEDEVLETEALPEMSEMFSEMSEMASEMSEMASEMSEMTSELYEAFSEGMKELLEDMGLDELSDELVAVKGDMDPADLKAMKIKHRNKELKDIVKADAEYLKAVFHHLEEMKDGDTQCTSNGEASVGSSAVPVISAVGAAMPEPVINITL